MSGGLHKEKTYFFAVSVCLRFERPVEVVQMKTTHSLQVVVGQKKATRFGRKRCKRILMLSQFAVISFSVDKRTACVLQKMHNTKKYLHTFNSGFARIKLHVNCFVFGNYIVSSKSLFDVLKKFFKCIETRSSKLGSRTSKLDSRKL